ncbi:MAG TPA: HNH endonuclease signature motif containing protein [Actinomycetota bacterium]|nr:HNH endonuclease signature motif containing protein [Actinomycetota bacterium]
MDYSALRRGYLEPGEVCEVPGVGPIPVAAALAFASDAFLAAVVADGQDIKAVSHLGRTIPERLRTAVVARDPICVVPGCGEHEGLEIDHIIPVHHRGRTLLKNLCRLCEWHHYLKTYHGYMVDRVGGEWIWYGPNGPPPDPMARHPELVGAR